MPNHSVLKQKIKSLIGYSEFSWQLFKLKFGGHSPFSIDVYLTDRCNSACVFCGFGREHEEHDLDIDRWNEQLKKSIYLRKIKLFNICGGEPFLQPKRMKKLIISIIENANPLQIRIATNGLLTRVIVDFFDDIFSICSVPIGLKISFDGFGKTYEKIRGIKNGAEKVQDTIAQLNLLKKKNKLVKKRLRITLGLTLTKWNRDEFYRIMEYAKKENIGLFYKPVIYGGLFENKDLDLSNLEMEYNVDKKQLLEYNYAMLSFIKSRGYLERWTYKAFYRYFSNKLLGKSIKLKSLSAKGVVYLNAKGQIVSNLPNPVFMGDFLTDDFDTIWENEETKKIRSGKDDLAPTYLTPCDTIPALYVKHFPFFF